MMMTGHLQQEVTMMVTGNTHHPQQEVMTLTMEVHVDSTGPILKIGSVSSRQYREPAGSLYLYMYIVLTWSISPSSEVHF